MECKADRIGELHNQWRGFNRDIVECKGRNHVDLLFMHGDLIETLWNVKRMQYPSSSPDASRFNRDIVECKVW